MTDPIDQATRNVNDVLDRLGPPAHLLPCGCLDNEAGAHRGECPDFETVYPANGSRDPDRLTWRPREESN